MNNWPELLILLVGIVIALLIVFLPDRRNKGKNED